MSQPKRKGNNLRETQCYMAYNAFERKRELQGVDLTFIPKPPPAEDIDNFGAKLEDRLFKKITFPDVEFIEDNNGDIIESKFKDMDSDYEVNVFLPLMYKYRTEGYWFYCKDKLEYITGDHWYYLNIAKIPVVKEINGLRRKLSDNPFFVDADRDFFLYWRECEIQQGCFGMIMTSSRRSGKTYKFLAILLNNATMIPEALCGIQAQNSKMAESIFGRIVKMWKKLPKHEFFYPSHIGNSNPKTSLDFSEPSRRSSKQKYFNYSEVLDSHVDFRSTTATAYDSEGIWRLYLDEASKMENCSIMDLYNVVRETLADGSTALGKVGITSTAENLGGKTLQQYEALWKESMVSTRDAFGTTKSGLYRYFQSAAMAYRHDEKDDGNIPAELNKPTIDKWGYSDEETAIKVIKYLRQNKSGESLIHFIRKYPLSSKEAFMYAEVISPLDIQRINQHIIFNEEIESLRTPTVRGDLDWEHGVPDTRVIWYPKDDGMWEMFKLPEEEDRNKIAHKGSSKSPIGVNFVSAVDPFSHKIVQDERRMSMAASHVMTTTLDKYTERTFVMQYHGRRSDPNDFFEDMIKQSVFYSCMMLPENQKYEIINYFFKRGYGGYIEMNPLNEKKDELGISTRGDDTRSRMVNGLANYVKAELGQQENGTWRDQVYTRMLEDWRDFDPENWTKFDLTVSAMIVIIYASYKKQKRIIKTNLQGFIRKYDVRGK